MDYSPPIYLPRSANNLQNNSQPNPTKLKESIINKALLNNIRLVNKSSEKNSKETIPDKK